MKWTLKYNALTKSNQLFFVPLVSGLLNKYK